jgi:uncharacterized membrane protein YccC
MNTRVGVAEGCGVLVGPCVAVGCGVSVGGTGVAVGAFFVISTIAVSTAWVEIASKVGLGSIVGIAVGVAVGAAVQPLKATINSATPIKINTLDFTNMLVPLFSQG